MKDFSKRKAFTLVELLIVIIVIGVLSAMLMFSSSEAVSSAHATRIINNLFTLKTATLSWYKDHREQVADDGRVIVIQDPKKAVTDRDNTKPIQEWSDEKVKLSDYLDHSVSATINLNTRRSDNNSTNLGKGYYGVCDAGNGNRTIWYAGYCFTDKEAAVREKLKARKEQYGLKFGGTDAKFQGNSEEAVWILVINFQ